MKSPSWDLASYGTADYTVNHLSLTAGARYDYVRVPFYNQLASNDNTTNTFRHFSPRAGISITVASGLSFYGSVGGSFAHPPLSNSRVPIQRPRATSVRTRRRSSAQTRAQ